MKIVNLAVVLGVLAWLQPTQAQQTEQETVVPIKASEGRIELPVNYRKMWPDNYQDIKGGYTLSNGMTLSIVSRGTGMYAYVDDDQPHKIVATGSNTYVALDRQLRVELVREGDEASGWVTMVVPPRTLASGEVVPEKLLVFALR
jgi:hypothetical protein